MPWKLSSHQPIAITMIELRASWASYPWGQSTICCIAAKLSITTEQIWSKPLLLQYLNVKIPDTFINIPRYHACRSTQICHHLLLCWYLQLHLNGTCIYKQLEQRNWKAVLDQLCFSAHHYICRVVYIADTVEHSCECWYY